MTIRLYSYWRSSAAYRVRIALNLKSLDYRIVPVSLAPGTSEHRQEQYRARNPQMLVPFLEDGDVVIGQSMAMLEYLEERYADVPLLPKTEPLRSRVRAFCNIIACDIHPLQNLRVLHFVKEVHVADSAKWAVHWMTEGLKALEQLIGDGPYAFGNNPTFADALLVPQIYNARRFEVPLTDFPKLVAAADYCSRVEAFRKAAPENQPDAV